MDYGKKTHHIEIEIDMMKIAEVLVEELQDILQQAKGLSFAEADFSENGGTAIFTGKYITDIQRECDSNEQESFYESDDVSAITEENIEKMILHRMAKRFSGNEREVKRMIGFDTFSHKQETFWGGAEWDF